MDPSRRKFLKIAGAAGAVAASPAATTHAMTAEEEVALNAQRRGVLVDTTKCIGCRACEAACAETNDLPGPADEADFSMRRRMSTRAYTIVNSSRVFGAAPSPTDHFIKRQCMHCLEPACASACLARALDKTPTGPVVYHKERCLGCRYCMVACPFSIPKYEYESPLPYVKKCTFCADRQAKGQAPACTSVCPTGALQFGLRDELIDLAHERIYAKGSTYVRHIYGEKEVGGTSWLYLTDIPFDQLGLPADVGTYAYSSLTQASLAAVPFVLTLWPPLLMGLYTFSKRRDEVRSAGTHRREADDE